MQLLHQYYPAASEKAEELTKFILDKIDISSLKVLTHDIKVFKRYFFVNFGIFIFLTICTLVYNVPIYNVPT